MATRTMMSKNYHRLMLHPGKARRPMIFLIPPWQAVGHLATGNALTRYSRITTLDWSQPVVNMSALLDTSLKRGTFGLENEYFIWRIAKT